MKVFRKSVSIITTEHPSEQWIGQSYSHEMPCVFTDEEFGEELRLSEVSGIASEEEIEKMFAKWEHS